MAPVPSSQECGWTDLAKTGESTWPLECVMVQNGGGDGGDPRTEAEEGASPEVCRQYRTWRGPECISRERSLELGLGLLDLLPMAIPAGPPGSCGCCPSPTSQEWPLTREMRLRG